MTATATRPKGFVLIREYPNCGKKVGGFEPYTTGEFLRYPDVWKPVYEEDGVVETSEHIIKITVTKKN